MSKTLYQVIEVNPKADTKEIEAKCIELGKKYHPKTNPDDLDAAIMYKEIMTAYATLRDPTKRAAYDASIKNTKPTIDSSPKSLEKPLNNIETKNRNIGVGLACAIIVVPPIFVWFLLGKGYSKKIRWVAFVWLAIWLSLYNKYNSEEYQAYKAKNEQRKAATEQVAEQSDEDLKNRIYGTWKSGIKDALIDPDSAKFKNVIFVLTVNRTPFACGEVNSKNSMGGYTGYKRFITAGLKEYTFLQGEKEGFNEYWKQVCVEGKKY